MIEYLSVTKAAKRLGLSESRVKALAKEGRIGSKRGGRNWLFTEAELARFAQKPRRRGRPRRKKRTTDGYR